MFKKLNVIAVAVGLLVSINLNAETWKFAIEAAKGDVLDIYAKEFARVMKKESKGKIKTRIYYYGQLGGENDIVELAANKTIHFVSVGTGHLGSFVPEVQAISIPYVMTNNEKALFKILTESKTIYNDLAPVFKNVNLKLLSMVAQGKMVWGGNKLVRTPKDFSGVKIRTFTSKIPVETYKAYGADPTAFSWGEVYSGLQLGTIDFMYNPHYFIYAAKWHDVIKYVIDSDQNPYVSTVSTNLKWFNNLSSKKKAWIKKASKSADKVTFAYLKELTESNIRKMKKENKKLKFIKLNDEEVAVFKERAKTLHEVYYQIVEDSYRGTTAKKKGRALAKKILKNLIKEVEEAERKYQ